MPETNDLPPGLRSRLVRGLEAPPLRRPQPWQARYARVARHLPGPAPRARRPRLALLTGAIGIVAVATLAATVSTGDVDPRLWTGRALTEVRHTFVPPPVEPAPRPEVTASPAATPPPAPAGTAPARQRPAGPAPARATPPPRAPAPTPGVPAIIPGGLPIPSPLPTLPIPFSASDFSHHVR